LVTIEFDGTRALIKSFHSYPIVMCKLFWR